MRQQFTVFSMLQITFYEEKKQDEQHEHDQDLIATFVKYLVQTRVFPVNKENSRGENYDEDHGKDQLAF